MRAGGYVRPWLGGPAPDRFATSRPRSLIAVAAAAAPDTLVEVNGVPTRRDDMPRRHPHIVRRQTSEWMRDFVVTEVARVSAMADPTDYLTERSQTWVAMSICIGRTPGVNPFR
jgi:hypothetical protein